MDPVQHIVLHSTGEGTSFWAAVLPVVIGGFLAITASILVQWLQIRFATKIRKKQIQAERETDALEEAYWRLNVIGGLLIPASSSSTIECCPDSMAISIADFWEP